MPVSQELLEYQKVDGQLRKLEQEIAGSEERKRSVQAKKIMEGALERLETLDRHAADLIRLRDELVKRVDETSKGLAEFADLDEMVEEGGADVSFYKKNVQQLLDRLRAAKNDLQKLLGEIEGISAEYKKLMEQGRQANKQYKEYNEKFKALKTSRADEVKALNDKLEEIAKNIDPAILDRYRQKRKEKIFPIVVPLNGGLCVCGMDFPLAQQSKLAGGNVIECEHCHRFVYKP